MQSNNRLLVKKTSIKEQIQDILFGRIISGELSPGERLKIAVIAESLNVSQAPVREAIQCLVTGGYLEQTPNVGARVKEFTSQEIENIYQIREILEVGALRKVSINCGELAKILEGYLSEMIKAAQKNNLKQYAVNDTEFHRNIIEASKNDKMIEIWESLLVPIFITGKIQSLNVTLTELVHLHQPVVDALKKGNFNRAAESLETHYRILCKSE